MCGTGLRAEEIAKFGSSCDFDELLLDVSCCPVSLLDKFELMPTSV